MDRPLALVWSTVSLEKQGSRPHENEDAAAGDPAAGRFAVSDGATEGWESRAWAAALARAFVRQPPEPTAFAPWHAGVRREWTPPAVPEPAPWYAAIKRDEGAFATLLGLELVPAADPPGWGVRAVAVGDSCLFVVRDEQVHTAFPITHPSGFGNHPKLIPSASPRCPEPDRLTARANPGDLVLLATDAVAAAVLGPRSAAAWRGVLDGIDEGLTTGRPRRLLTWFQDLQATRNDDLTLVALRLPAHPTFRGPPP